MKSIFSEKTTLVAIFGLIIILGLLVAMILKVITGAEFLGALAPIGAFMGILIGLFSGDRTKQIPTEDAGE